MKYVYCHIKEDKKALLKKGEDSKIIPKGSLKKGEIITVHVPDELNEKDQKDFARHEFELKLREMAAQELAETLIATLEKFCEK